MKYNVAGIEPLSLTDWPGHIAAVLFTRGCNFRCSWCHNKELVYPHLYPPLIDDKEIDRFLARLKPNSISFLYDGVVVSGGEPLTTPSLSYLLKAIKKIGLKVRLDTNGSMPDKLISLIEEELIDEVAVDYKVPFDMYKMVGCDDVEAVKKSLSYIASTGKGYIRTTLIDGIHTTKMIEQMRKELHDLVEDFVDWRFNNKELLSNTV